MRDDKTRFLFVLRDEYLPPGGPSGVADPRALLAHAFADIGWERPRILEAPGIGRRSQL